MFDRVVLMILNFVLMFDDLTIEFINQAVDGSVQIVRQTFDMNIFAAEVEINIRFMPFILFSELIDCQDDSDINDLIGSVVLPALICFVHIHELQE